MAKPPKLIKYPRIYNREGVLWRKRRKTGLNKGVEEHLPTEKAEIDKHVEHLIHEGIPPAGPPHGESPIPYAFGLMDAIAYRQGLLEARKGGFALYRSDTRTPQSREKFSTAGVTMGPSGGGKWKNRIRGENARREVPSWNEARKARKEIKQLREQFLSLSIKSRIPPQQLIDEYNKNLNIGGRARHVATAKRQWYTLFLTKKITIEKKPWTDVDMLGVRLQPIEEKQRTGQMSPEDVKMLETMRKGLEVEEKKAHDNLVQIRKKRAAIPELKNAA
ncbi:MAG: hypothetical protein V1676_03445 [Candidatus Diapherotrites archaeon]